MNLPPLHLAAMFGDLKTLDVLLKNSPPLNDVTSAPGLTPLMMAARGGQVGAIHSLTAAGATVNVSGQSGLTALHIAAVAGQPQAVAALLEAGADVSAQTEKGCSAVHLAAATGNVGVLVCFEDAGVDVLEADPDGMTPVQYARSQNMHDAVTFLEDARLRSLYRVIDDLRDTVLELHCSTTDAEGSWPSRQAREADQAAQATFWQALPASTPSTSNVNAEQMRAIAAARPAISPSEWRQILADHSAYLESGGSDWPGVWECVIQSDVVFSLYNGAPATTGKQADLHVRRLGGLSAAGADLQLAHLVGLVASGVDFSGANLARVYATDSDFSGARFDGADLSRADLSRSDLRGASFVGADLSFTDLENCDLRGADFRGAKLLGTLFPGTNLEGALL